MRRVSPGVIPCGTTGESPTLSQEEKKKLILVSVETLKGSGVKVIAGTGSNDTAATIELSRWASEQGVDGVLLVTPYYNKPSQAGLEAHFLSRSPMRSAARLMLYNVPGPHGRELDRRDDHAPRAASSRSLRSKKPRLVPDSRARSSISSSSRAAG